MSRRPVLLFEASSSVGVPVRQMCECVHLFASNHWDGLAGKREILGVGKRAQDLSKVVLLRQSSHADIQGIHKCACDCESRECVCVLSPVNFSSYQMESRKRTWRSICLVWIPVMLYMGVAEGNALSVAICASSPTEVLQVCVCVWNTRWASLLYEPVNRKAAASSIGWES